MALHHLTKNSHFPLNYSLLANLLILLIFFTAPAKKHGFFLRTRGCWPIICSVFTLFYLYSLVFKFLVKHEGAIMENAKINNRTCSRTPVDLDVVIYFRDTAERQAKLQDISFGGAFIATNNTDLQVNDLVTIGLYLENIDEEFYTMAATVVRRAAEGAGLSFDEYDQDTLKSLRKLYHDALN
jgi:hypothetical protein